MTSFPHPAARRTLARRSSSLSR